MVTRDSQQMRSTRRITVLHVLTGLNSGRAARRATRELERLVLSDREPRQIVVSLAKGDGFERALQDAGIEVHCLGLAQLSRMPSTLIRLIVLLRRIRPNVVMTWLNQAHLLAMVAAIASGVGVSRVVWNLSGSRPNATDGTRKTGVRLRLLARLSLLPWGVAVDSLSRRQAYEALGFRPRRWFRLHSITRETATEKALGSYSQLWRLASGIEFASGVEPLSVGPGLLERALPWLKKHTLARLRRLFLSRTTFIAVTGSYGKSTTVRLTARILATNGPCYCHRFEKNQIGHSIKAVLSSPSSAKYCVQEASAYQPGVIAKHVRILKPHIAIVTAVGTDHYTKFRGLEATAKEKGQLIETLPRQGVAILNADDVNVRAMAARTRARVVLFGLSPDAEIRATEVSGVWPDRLTLTAVHGDESVRIHAKLVGEHWITSILAAITCGVVCGLDLKTCAQAIEKVEPIFGRSSIHAKPNGPTYIFDEKASFSSLPAGLTFIGQAKARRKTIVFGTISDTPGRGHKKYRQVARKALEVADRVVFVGRSADAVSKLLRQGGLQKRLFPFQTTYQASAFLAEEALPGELIFIKASSSDHLERIFLSQLDQVVCWREKCRAGVECPLCRNYRKPHAPPFGLAEDQSALVGDSLQKQ